MNIKEILKHVDHTLLKPIATWEDIQKICDEIARKGTKSVYISLERLRVLLYNISTSSRRKQ